MLIIATVAGLAATFGALAYLVAVNAPFARPAAPQLAPGTVAEEVQRHPRLARWFRRGHDATEATGVALGLVALVAVIAAAVIGVLLAMVRTSTGFAVWDLKAANWGARHASDLSTRVLKDITFFGGTLPSIGLALLTLVVIRRRVNVRHAFWFLTVVIAGENLVANLTKFIVDRARPDIDRLAGFSGPSFPSGHATTAAAVFAAFALLLTRGRSRRAQAAAAGVAVGAAVAVAATRVLLGVHWFTDVLAGLVLGWAWFAVSSMAFGGRVLRFAHPAEVAEAVAEAVPVAGPPTPPTVSLRP